MSIARLEDLSLEEQRQRDEEAIYERFIDPDEMAAAECEHPGCDMYAVDGVAVDVIDDEPLYVAFCAKHLGAS